VAEQAGSRYPLRLKRRPAFEAGDNRLRVVDLFAGCGGLSLGAGMAARELGRGIDLRLAVDYEEAATTVYSANFPKAASVRTESVESLFSSSLRAPVTETESALVTKTGVVDILMGGPPCQGHSNLNNHTRRNDPKNALYLYMVRAAALLQPDVVLIENVPAVLHDTFSGANVVEVARHELKALGYEVADTVVSLVDLGVAQKRKRHILLATSASLAAPSAVFENLGAEKPKHRTLRWAIGDLARSDGTGWDKPPSASETNETRMQYLVEKEVVDLPNALRPKCHQGVHSYVSMYGRLTWSDPAQTITSGFGSIGQGRYMHPSEKRALTAHEAARIQGFPDYFDFSDIERKSDLATMIGNAVPPQLSASILSLLYGSDSSDGADDHTDG